MAEIVVALKNITKRFPGIIANDKVNFDLRRGEIHTLLGENGAGKSTLMNILDGIYQPDEGEIFINGKKVEIKNPSDAMRLGIGMIHQHFMLVESLTVLENVILGLAGQGLYVNKKEISRKIDEVSQRYNLCIDPSTKIWQLSVGEQQRVEIIKTLFRGAQILILDEPTAVLTPQEAEASFEIYKQMVSEGKSIVFISHKLNEVMDISDRITVLRKGKYIDTVDTDKITEEELATMMVGRKVLFRLERKPLHRRDKILQVENVKAYDDKGLLALNGINLEVHSGEIFGLAGVAGNGQKILSEAIAGLRKVADGKILIAGEDLTNANPREIFNHGVSYIPPDRLKVGLVPELSSVDNAILRRYNKPPIYRNYCIDHAEAENYAKKLIQEYDIMVPREDAPVKLLSGGNMQKLLLAREISENPKLLIAVHPSRGLDVGATEFVRKALLKQRENGVAVFLISEDLDEIFMISDRIGVIYEGQILDTFDIEEAKIEKIGLLMAGMKSTDDIREETCVTA
ncbi:MAG: heme ABC transporter ATP-binding protein [Deltaproteobacteria bacterium]|nr:MAG: heme ABC transporter ATP-binding protein [Deltaproteobacteria bacterium]